MSQPSEESKNEVAPVVSVIIPTYKHRDLVMETLASVWAQTFQDFEIIVIDDGSPDGTAQLLRPLAQEGRIRLIEQENRGQAAARNVGIAQARGEFIALLDDDDLWPDDKLQWQVEALRERPHAVLVYGYAHAFGNAFGKEVDWIWPDCQGPQGQVQEAFYQWNWIASPGQMLVRHDAMRVVNGFDTRIWGADDWDLYIRLAARGEFIYSHRLSLRYRYHANNASHNARRMYLNLRRVMHKHLGRWPRAGNARAWWSARRFVRSRYHESRTARARAHTACGDWKKARVQWRRVLALEPGAIVDKDTLKHVLLAFSNGKFPPSRPQAQAQK